MIRNITIIFRRRGIPALLFLLLTAALVACAPVVSPPANPARIPASFSSAGEIPLPAQWWRSLNDPALDALVDEALSNNFSLQATWDRLAQAEATARKAGAGLSPTLDLQSGASRTRQRSAGVTDDSDSFSLGLSAGYEIDLWGRIRSSREAARLDADASAEDLQSAAVTLSGEVASAWYQLVEKRGQLALLDAQQRTNLQTLELVTLQFRTGQVGAADVLQQRQLVESSNGEKAQVQAQAAELENRLSILLGRAPGEGDLPAGDTLADLSVLPQTGLPSDLLQRRPDLRSAYYDVLAADSRVAAAIADRFPTLSLSADLTTSGGEVRDLFDNWLANLAGNLVAPLVDGGQRVSEVERTKSAASEALNTYRQTVLDALGEVEDALSGEGRQREYIDSLGRQLELARLTQERVRDRYIKGTEDYQRVLDAILSHQGLQRTRLTALRDLYLDRIDLCRALAGGWELTR